MESKLKNRIKSRPDGQITITILLVIFFFCKSSGTLGPEISLALVQRLSPCRAGMHRDNGIPVKKNKKIKKGTAMFFSVFFFLRGFAHHISLAVPEIILSTT